MANEINIDLGKRRSLKANIGVPGYLGKGDSGTGIESITYKGEDESGGNVYTVLLTDGTSYDITAPKGAAGVDGADGITPHIGDNGNWYLGTTDTGKPSRGETGLQGPVGPVGPQGPTGATGPKGDTGDTGATGAHGDNGADGKSAYQYAVEGGFTGTEEEFAAKLAQEKFVNPNALTFTGAVTGSYDGSAPLTVKIPSAVTDDHINSLIDTKLGVIENGAY